MPDPGADRPRVVMLVDNAVEGDSRVQKQARTMADRGFDVVLLGGAVGAKARRWRIGDARVRVVPVPSPLRVRPHELRRAWLRSPLAYRSGRTAEQRQQLAAARRVDAATATDRQALGVSSGSLPQRVRTGMARRSAAAYEGWVAMRVRRTEASAERRRAADGPLDRVTTAFWSRLSGDRAWRRLDPSLWDWELAMGRLVDRLQPDLVHANDPRMLGVGARAVLRARRAGRQVALVYDAHEWTAGRYIAGAHPRWLPAQVAHEAEHIGLADAVVTVSEEMVELLTTTYRLQVPTAIVRNAPASPPPDAEPIAGIREVCDVGESETLLLYAGAMAPQRGGDLLVDALGRLTDDVHLVLLARRSPYVLELQERAAALGVGHRLHVAPYVPVDRIVEHIASADVGLHASVHVLNHEVDLPTKYYEYAHARLPVVVSDLRTTSAATRALGNGEVFRAGDLDDLVRAVERVLADRQRYVAAYERAEETLAEWTWDRQADVLAAVYDEVLDRVSGRRRDGGASPSSSSRS